MSRLFLFASLMLSMFYSSQSLAQGDQTKITVNIAPGRTTGAWLHLPDDYNNTTTRYPLIIFLHGVGEGGTDVNVVLSHGLPRIISQGAKMQFTVNGKLFKFITVSPQIPNGWASEDMIESIMDDIKSKYRIDASRVYLTGLSAGGYGVLNYIATDTSYSGNLAAIVPVSSAAIDANKLPGLCNVVSSNIATWFHCGSNDGFIDNQVNYVNRINACKPTYPAIATSYPGGTHSDNVWDKVYDATNLYQSPNIYEWMLQYNGTDTVRATPAPIAAVVSDRISIKLPVDSVFMDASPSTAPRSKIVSYAWKLITGHPVPVFNSISTARIKVNKLILGTYLFSVTVKNAIGKTSTKQVTVVVNAEGGAMPGCDNCKFLVTPGVDGGGYINGDSLKVQPGDTICIHSGNYKYLQFFNFTGTAAKPIVFMNCGGQVKVGNGGSYGCIFNNVKYFKVTGSGTSDKYGFVVNGVSKPLNVGLAMGKGCTDYEAERFEITGSEVGVMAKINPDCDVANQYPYFAIRNVKLHDIYIHDISGEGMYIGNTAPNGTLVTCSDGTTKNVLPPRMYNLRIYNVTTVNTGWDGIQVASAPEDVEIYNNSVSNFGVLNVGSQQAGIILGGETNGKVYNNSIIKGTGNGIEVFGIGLCYVYNNIISDAGIDGTTAKQDALFIDDRPTKNNYIPLHVNVFNNTIVNSGRDAIRYMNSYGTVAKGNLFYNNLLVNPGLRYLNIQAGIDNLASNNINNADTIDAKFVNAQGKDFHLTALSSGIDKGKDLSVYFKTDIDGDVRPMDSAYDVGADEHVPTTITNQLPLSVAGADTIIKLPVSIIKLNGSGSSDSDGNIVSYAWTQVSGPVMVTITAATTATPLVSAMTSIGTYVFKLIVTDNKGAIASDEINVILQLNTSVLPVANAGADKTILQPRNSSDASGIASTASDGTITGYNWTQVSGPTNASIVSPNAVKTDLNRLTDLGTYIFRLTVTNNKGVKATDDISVIVQPKPTVTMSARAGEKVLDIAVLNASGIQVYPNPVVSILHLNLQLKAAAAIVVRIFNSNGEVQGTYYLGTISNIQKNIDVNNLTAGAYIIRITDDKNLDMSYKFVKSNQ